MALQIVCELCGPLVVMSHDNIFDYWEDKQILRKKKRERGRYTNDKIFNHQNNGFNNPKVKEIERI